MEKLYATKKFRFDEKKNIPMIFEASEETTLYSDRNVAKISQN